MIYAYSKKLDKAQLNYSVTDKELLGVVKATEHFRRYLLGRRFVLRTDHKALEFIQKAKDQNTRLLRWALKLQEFDYQVEYIKGEDNGADGLSRSVEEETRDVNAIENLKSKEEKKKILEEVHELLGHGGKSAMKFFMADKTIWPEIYKDIDELVDECEICLRGGDERCNSKNSIVQTTKMGELWEIDMLGRIPARNGSSKFIFVAVDHFTKYVKTKVVKTKSKEVIAQAVKELIVEKHRAPTRIYSDNGKEFQNETTARLSQNLGFKWVFNSPGHHNAIGAVERVNRTLMTKIKKLCKFGENNWEGVVEKAINLSPHRALGTSPYIMRRLLTDHERFMRIREINVRKVISVLRIKNSLVPSMLCNSCHQDMVERERKTVGGLDHVNYTPYQYIM